VIFPPFNISPLGNLKYTALFESMDLCFVFLSSFLGKTLLAKAVANQTAATFLRVVGSELIQKYLVRTKITTNMKSNVIILIQG